MGAKKKGAYGWPRTIKQGSASVKVYKNIHPRTASGFIYVLAWHTPAGRQRGKFADEKDALEEARLKAAQLAHGHVEASQMTQDDRAALVAARALTGDTPLLSALQEWKTARDLTNGNVLTAAQVWAQKTMPTFKRVLASDAVDKFISAKERAGKQAEHTYRAKLDPIKKYFPGLHLDTITSPQWSAYLEQYQDGVTRNDLRKRAVTLCRWAQKAGFLPRGLQLEIELTERAIEEQTRIGILRPQTYLELLRFFHEKHPHYLGAVTLAGFCGIRSDEIHGKREDREKRQQWEDVNLAEKFVSVTVAKRNTPAWRLVHLVDEAIEWLLLCPNRKGPVSPPAAMERVREIAIAAGFNLPTNAFRHSFITYKIAVTGDKAATATEAGNSVREIDRRYRVPRPKSEGLAWFSSGPGKLAKVVPMERSAS